LGLAWRAPPRTQGRRRNAAFRNAAFTPPPLQSAGV
jgi:hypothetical protein